MSKRKPEEEHKSAINPNPTIDCRHSKRRRRQVVLSDDDTDDEAPAVLSVIEEGDEENEEDEDDDDERLSSEQEARKAVVFKPEDIVEVEYKGPDGMTIGYGVVKELVPATADDPYPAVKIAWIYEKDDLLAEEDAPDEDTLVELDFDEGDMTFSDNIQQVYVYNCVRTCNEMRAMVEFDWEADGALRPVKDLRPEAATAPAEEELEGYLVEVKAFLLSYKPWDDTKFGRDMWFVLNALLTMGRSANNTRFVLEDIFFDSENHMECVSSKVTWRELSHAVRQKCSACSITRMLSWEWKETGWKVGKTCKHRVEVLQYACKSIFNLRANAASSRPFLPQDFIKQAYKQLRDVRTMAMKAVAGMDV